MTTMYEEGSPSSPLLVLGEAPAKTEARLGRPFCGQAGDVLNDCLHTAGLARSQCYILNAFPFEVHKDRGDNILRDGELLWSVSKGFTEAGMEAAKPTMERINASKSRAIMPLGRPAFDLVSAGHKPIMKWRGSPLWSERFNRKYIPSVHPAATIHGVYVWRYLIISDMLKISKELDSYELKLPQRNFIIRPTYADVYHFLNACREAKCFATDLEVMNFQVYCFSMSYKPDEALVIPFRDDRGTEYWDEDDEIRIWKMYAELMSDPEIMKVNQNIVGFDAPFLLQQNNIHTCGPLGDTMIAQHIIYPEFPKGLDFIASMHTREPYWKDEGKIWKKLDWDWDTFLKYCGKDGAVALEAWSELSGDLTAGGYWPTYDMTVEMSDILTAMTVRGLEVDKGKLEATDKQLEIDIAAKQEELHQIVGFELNVASSKQCQAYFYDQLGLGPYKNATGGITTDDKAMSRIVRQAGIGGKAAKCVQDVRRLRKLKSTYMEVELDSDDRLRCSWNPRGTWTGRLSSSQTVFGTGMNLQNLDPEFKGFIVADGHRYQATSADQESGPN